MSFWTKFILNFRKPTWREAMMYYSDDEAYELILKYDLLNKLKVRKRTILFKKIEHPIIYCIYEKKPKLLTLLLDSPNIDIHHMSDGSSFLDLAIKAKLPAFVCQKLLDKNVESFYPHFMVANIVFYSAMMVSHEAYHEKEYHHFVQLFIDKYFTSHDDATFPLLATAYHQEILRTDLTLLDLCIKYENVDYLKTILNTQLFKTNPISIMNYLKDKIEILKLNKSIHRNKKVEIEHYLELTCTQLEKQYLEKHAINDNQIKIPKKRIKI